MTASIDDHVDARSEYASHPVSRAPADISPSSSAGTAGTSITGAVAGRGSDPRRELEATVMSIHPRPTDLDSAEMESALLRAAVGDYAEEASVLLLINFGHWLPQLHSAGLIAVTEDEDGAWARITWPALLRAADEGCIIGSGGQLRVLHAAASIADGHPVDLGDLVSRLDRRTLTLVLAAIAHAAGSYDHRRVSFGDNGFPYLGDRLPALVGWPTPA